MLGRASAIAWRTSVRLRGITGKIGDKEGFHHVDTSGDIAHLSPYTWVQVRVQLAILIAALTVQAGATLAGLVLRQAQETGRPRFIGQTRVAGCTVKRIVHGTTCSFRIGRIPLQDVV